MITEEKIHEIQKKWGDGIVKIGTLMNDEYECVELSLIHI